VNFKDDWYKRTSFELVDAAKVSGYRHADGVDFTHIYSYNKVMSESDLKGICESMNKT